MKTGFVHSVKVPRFYKVTAQIATQVKEQGASLKQLTFQKKHPNIKGVYALALSTLTHGEQLDIIIEKTRILLENPRLNHWLAKVCITELLWGKQTLPTGSKPLDTILNYEKQLRDEANLVRDMDQHVPVLNQVKKPRYVRVNVLKATVDEIITSLIDEGWQLVDTKYEYEKYLKVLSNLQPQTFVKDIHIPEMLVFPPGTEFYDYRGYEDGSIVLQDKASCLPSFLLQAPPGSVVLDMCAAPGMKTTHLAAIMQNQGKIYSVELHPNRYKILTEMVQKMNCSCVETVLEDSLTLSNKLYPDVEYILVDPSCSGSGMTDRFNIGKDVPSLANRLKKLQSFQVMLLTHALLNFPNVKRVVYSTCSIYPEENEQVVDEVLGKVGDAYELVPAKNLLQGKWNNYSSVEYKCKDNCLYAKPDVDKTNGFFVAVFERINTVPLPDYNQVKGRIKNRKIDNKDKEEEVEAEDEASQENGTETVVKKEPSTESPKKKKKRKSKKKKIVSENAIGESSEIVVQAKHISATNQDEIPETDSVTNAVNVLEQLENVKKGDKRKIETLTEDFDDNDTQPVANKKRRKKNKKGIEIKKKEEEIEQEPVIKKESLTENPKKKKKRKKLFLKT